MILGLGLDIVKISRIEKIYDKFGEGFLEKIFTKNEIIKVNSFSSQVKKKRIFGQKIRR